MATKRIHPYDYAYVMHYMVAKMDDLEDFDIQELMIKFNYTNTSIYRLIRKINDNQIQMGRKQRIVKVKDCLYKGVVEDDEKDYEK